MKISGLNKSYGDNHIFEDFELELSEGERIAIMGESGCGKTTLIRLILGLEKPDGGKITDVPGQVSVVFQEDRLMSDFSVYENLSVVMSGDKVRDRIEQALKAVGMAECMDMKVKELSGGMCRRVAILRALLHESSLLVMDEPFKGLDENSLEKTISYVEKNIGDRSFILVTHDEKEGSRLTDRILKLT